eukprot:TRINITY_DN5460_c0_g1_i13.p1 TRINITY_DN5460_c0_g1~~TRINITY_DN5460_c0_g1_i13.p1  ORF type:complete len:263 (+),score=51.55 TRINITY_DN5460_c0_g1_i13:204-992(+)
MGNALTKRNFLISTGVTFTCLTLYKLSARLLKQFKDRKFLQELDSIGHVHIQHNRSLSPSQFTQILSLLNKYSYEYTKELRRSNQKRREELLEVLDYEGYVAAVISDHEGEKEAEGQVKDFIFDKLVINQEVLDASTAQYQEEMKREEMQFCEYILKSEKNVTEANIKEIASEKLKLESELGVRIKMSARLKRRCIKVLGNNWEEVLKTYTVNDLLYAKYKMPAKFIEANIYKLKLTPCIVFKFIITPVSYTHLTLPTICSV